MENLVQNEGSVHVEGNMSNAIINTGDGAQIIIDPQTEVLLKRTKKRFKSLCQEYGEKNKKILVVGDAMLDHKIMGIEAKYNDVQKHEILKRGGEVYMVNREPKTLGGAANIAMALSEISNVTLISVIGSDCDGSTLKKECENYKIQYNLIETPEVKTTTKIYIYRLTEGPDKEVIRFDREDTESMTSYCYQNSIQNTIINEIKKYVNNIDCIIIKDHQKGMVSKELFRKISEAVSNNQIPLYVDPKYDWEKFKDVTIKAIFPNMKEAASALYDIKKDEFDIKDRDNNCELGDNDYDRLVEKYRNCCSFIIKAARKGATLISLSANDYEKEEIKPFFVGDEFKTDVGCGDVLDAFAIVGMLSNHTLEESVLFANFVAGLKTKKSLGEHVSLDNIKKELDKVSFEKYFKDNLPLIKKIEMIEADS